MFKGLDPLEDLPNLNLILPPEYDGQGDSIQELGNFWYNELVQAADWFKEDEKFKAEWHCLSFDIVFNELLLIKCFYLMEKFFCVN